jgi:phage tail-like protein
MARTWALDPFQARLSTVFDLSGTSPLSPFADLDLSESASPFRLLVSNTIAQGFSKVSLPEVTVETQEVKQVNRTAPLHIVTGTTIGQISLSRGSFWVDGDFFEWIKMASQGKAHNNLFRRDLLVIWFDPRLELGGSVGGVTVAVPCKMFYLGASLPVSYKAGTDFDPNDSQISIQELTLQPDAYSEAALTI